MNEYSLSCQIRECAAPDGGLLLELTVEGQEPPYARATVSGEQLALLRTWFGLERSDVVSHLHQALLKSFRKDYFTTEITNVIQVPPFRLRYLGWFTFRADREISTGITWYDLLGDQSWPELDDPILRYAMKAIVFDILDKEDREKRYVQPQQANAS
jgi:hypothetical protein